MFYYFNLDSDGSTVLGYVAHNTEPSTPPPNQVACTKDQAMAWKSYKVVDGQIVSNLSGAQSAQINTLRTAAKAAIVSGFNSSALGSAYSYPSDPDTQSNIGFAATSGGSLHCALNNVWSFQAHTPAEATQVQADLWTHIQAQQAQFVNLSAQINAATSVADILAIVWPTGT